jgi:predicted DNA-binding transcriptional regulator YafY
MNKINRITAILTQLQSKRIVTAKSIAERFQVSLRTVYRDIKTLQEAGVPIGSENGVGYFIVDGYKLPPVMFTEEEANALITAEKLVLQKNEKSLTDNYVSALIKIKSVLRNTQKEKIELLESRIGADAKYTITPKTNYLATIQKAIIESIVLKMEYQSIYKNELTKRTVKPLAFYFTENDWILVAYCNLRKSLREFRLDKMEKLELTDAHFSDFKDFNLTAYFKETRNLTD